MQGRSSAWVWTLASLLLAALVLRLASIRFGLPALNDPDADALLAAQVRTTGHIDNLDALRALGYVGDSSRR